MAFGFPAYHADCYLSGADLHDVRKASREALTALSWRLREDTNDKVVASTSTSFWSWGEKVFVRYSADGSVSVRSECILPTQFFDWGKNRANVDKFMVELKKRV